MKMNMNMIFPRFLANVIPTKFYTVVIQQLQEMLVFGQYLIVLVNELPCPIDLVNALACISDLDNPIKFFIFFFSYLEHLSLSPSQLEKIPVN